MTSTAKNYAGQNLRGRSFKGQDLSGADFSGTDIRGADFSNAILIGANFSKVQTGVQNRWLAFHLVVWSIMSTLSGFLLTHSSFMIANLFTPNNIETFSVKLGVSTVIAMAAIFIAIVEQGFNVVSFCIVVMFVASSIAVTVAVSFAVSGGGSMALFGTLVLIMVWVGTLFLSLALTIFEDGTVVMIAACLFGAWLGWEALSVIGDWMGNGSGFVTLFVLVATIIISDYVAWRTLKGDTKFDLLLKYAVAFASIGGTSFRGADLRNVDFTEANLRNSDFRNSREKNKNLKQTLWRQAKKLDRSRLGTSILSNPEVRELLVTGKPNPSKSYEGLNLRGANLDGVYLEKVNFKRAILSEASFRNANLEWVNLTETQAIGTDFTGAQMTGVCPEGWSYDHTTKLDDVDCRFVFELEHPNAKGSRERRPHDPDKEFVEGDFTKRYSETLNVVQLLIRNGINREAFIAAWENLAKEYPDINPDDIQEIKKKGQDVELMIAVPEDTDKGQFEHSFDRDYETKLKELEAKHQAQRLEDTNRTIDTIKDMFFALAEAKKGDVTVITTTEAKAMTDQNPVTLIARDITNSVVNLGEIKGNVTNAINQIPNKEDSSDIKTLLTQLQEAISADKDLADEDKADALEQVENLAKIALHDKPEEKSTLASKAIRALKRIIDTIPSIAKIVETVGKVFGA